jgi:hypothetical protein
LTRSGVEPVRSGRRPRDMRRLPSALAVLALVLTGCAPHELWAGRPPTPSPSICTPPAGGRCAADVPWPGPIMVSPNGRELHGIINCGGTLRVVGQTTDRVTIRLHVGAMGPGSMSCARVEIGSRLSAPLGHRQVYDGVSGQRLDVLVAPASVEWH